LRSRGSYILVGVWCLIAVVLANAYSGTLFSFLSVVKLEQIVNSIEELAQSKELQLIVQDKSELAIRFLVIKLLIIHIYWIFNDADNLHFYIQSATSGTEKLIGDSLRNNPGNLFATLAEAKRKLVTGSYALIYVKLKDTNLYTDQNDTTMCETCSWTYLITV
jgi:hypothetical protein